MNDRRLSRVLAMTLVLATGALPACVRSQTGNSASRDAPLATSPDVQAAGGSVPGASPQAANAGPNANAAGGAAPLPGAGMKDQSVGEPASWENLTVMPIYAKTQTDVGALTTLDAALAKGKAEVREVSDGGQVNTLVLENKGDVAIYVLAGTIVKGGKQDRQIGQDFILEPKQTAPIDAFCVEHGRWTDARDGQATGGKFRSSPQLVTSKVRAAAQYQKNQSEVWAKVEDVNVANHKSAQSGTLMATLDAPDVQQKRAALVEKVNGFLASAPQNGNVVGFAYAVDGHVKGARWFASHKVFDLFRTQLANGAAVDAITAQAERGNAPPPAAPKVVPAAVVQFVDDVDHAKITEKRDTAGATSNEYRESPNAYGSKAYRKPSAAAPAPAATPISQDYLSK